MGILRTANGYFANRGANSDVIGQLFLAHGAIAAVNADSLHNKINELKLVINSLRNKPSIIAITEVKHKTVWQTKLSEFSISGYEMYYNDFEKFSRGIIVYVDCRLKSKQLFLNSNAAEYIVIEIQSMYAHLV